MKTTSFSTPDSEQKTRDATQAFFANQMSNIDILTLCQIHVGDTLESAIEKIINHKILNSSEEFTIIDILKFITVKLLSNPQSADQQDVLLRMLARATNTKFITQENGKHGGSVSIGLGDMPDDVYHLFVRASMTASNNDSK